MTYQARQSHYDRVEKVTATEIRHAIAKEFWVKRLQITLKYCSSQERVASVHPRKHIPRQMHGSLTKLQVVQLQHLAPPSIDSRTNTSDRLVLDQGN